MRYIQYNNKLIIPQSLEFVDPSTIGCHDISTLDLTEEKAKSYFNTAEVLEPYYKELRETELLYAKYRQQMPSEDAWTYCQFYREKMTLLYARIIAILATNPYDHDLLKAQIFTAKEELMTIPYNANAYHLYQELAKHEH